MQLFVEHSLSKSSRGSFEGWQCGDPHLWYKFQNTPLARHAVILPIEAFGEVYQSLTLVEEYHLLLSTQ